jgi:putative serine protease PepD
VASPAPTSDASPEPTYRYPQAPEPASAATPPVPPTTASPYPPTAAQPYPPASEPAAQPYPPAAHPYQQPYPTSASAYPGAPAYPGYPTSAAPSGPTAYPTTAQPYPTTGQPYPPSPYPTSSGSPYPAYPGVGYQPDQPPPTGGRSVPKLNKRQATLGAAALAIALAGGAVGGWVGHSIAPASSTSNPLQVSGNTGNGNAAPAIDRSSLSSIASALQPAIVAITTDSAEGSGVIISSDGKIVTNNHVIDGFKNVTVTFNSGQQIAGTVIGSDAKTDIAVVQVNASNLVTAPWGDSDAVQVGDTVLAMGSPLGLQGSVTAGIVSGLHRTITTEASSARSDTSGGNTIGDAIQTDAPINPGNSGGALVSTKGEVIGINTAIATAGSDGNIGVGFAISSNRAKAIAEEIINGQPVGHPYLGVQVSSDAGGGAKVESVESGGAAAQAGMQAGDVIVKWGGRDIHTMEDLIGAIQSSTVGQQVQVVVNRGGSQQTLTVTVGEQ